jgi:hypothetical protein
MRSECSHGQSFGFVCHSGGRVQVQPIRIPVHLPEIEHVARCAGGNSAVFHLVLDRGFLPEGGFPFVGKAVPVAIVGWAAREVSELVQLVPILDPVGISVLSRGEVMSHDGGLSG